MAQRVPLPSPFSPRGHHTPARPPPGPSFLLPRVGAHQLRRPHHMPLHRHLHVPLRGARLRSEEHTSELQSRPHLVCRLLLEKKKYVSVSLILLPNPALHVTRSEQRIPVL